jgi:phosphatidylserine decarboxylase
MVTTHADVPKQVYLSIYAVCILFNYRTLPAIELLSLIIMTLLASLLAGAISLFLIWFNRDPERQGPLSTLSMPSSSATNNYKLIVSPSDGKVLYIRKFNSGRVPISRKFKMEVALNELKDTAIVSSNSSCYLIGIYLSPFDVHVTRAPISGKVTFVHYRKGHLFSRELLRFMTIDEMSTCVIKSDSITVGIVQMAAYVVRRVVLNIHEGDELEVGSRIGRIKMGSQVDLILTNHAGLRILTKPGDRVRAGVSVIAMIQGEKRQSPQFSGLSRYRIS